MHQLYDILAKRYCILHMRNMLTTFGQTMFCHYPITSSTGPVPWETPREHGKVENLPSSPQLFWKSEEEGVHINTGYRFLRCPTCRQNNHNWTSGGSKITVHEWMKSRPRTILTSLRRPSGTTRKLFVLTRSGPNGPMNQREDYQEAKRIKERLFQESGQSHPRLHAREQVRMRPDQPFAWHDEGWERVDPKTGGRWMTRSHHQALFKRLRGAIFFTVTNIKMV